MDRRRLERVPIAPGPRGVADLLEAMPRAFDGHPIAPIPATSATVSDTYIAHLLQALRPEMPLERDDIAVVLATSGSTGAPRGVMLSAAAVTASASGAAAALNVPVDDAAWLVAIPVTSAGGFAVVARAWMSGLSPESLASVGGGVPFSPRDFITATEQLRARSGNRALVTSLVPAQVSRLLDGPESAAALRSYDAILVGGARFDASLRDRARAAGVHAVSTYGLTETGGGCVYDGRAFDGVDVEAREGELWIRGDVLAAGYRLDPQRTADRFVGGWLRTGDLGSVTDGEVRVTGRSDDVVQVNGVNVATGAVERVISGVPGVQACAVIAIPDAAKGSRLHAYVVLDDAVDEVELARRCIDVTVESLGTAAAPAHVRAVASLPVLPNGKTDRAALVALVEEENSRGLTG